jgi:hypothetical protein
MTKKILLLLSIIIGFAQAQSFVQNGISYPTCFGACDGTVVLSTTTTPGPFTAVLTNSSSCPNSTVQSSTGNTITIGNLCTCASDYSINIYNSSMVLVGFEILQVPITATSALVLQTPTAGITSCGPCCDANVTVSFSGGYTPSSTHTVTVDGIGQASYTPIQNVCAGQHTLCVKDQANCVVCNTFTVGYAMNVNLISSNDLNFVLVPNPTREKITLTFLAHSSANEIKLMDLNGKIVFAQKFDATSQKKHEFDISHLPAGIYTAELSGLSGNTRQKIVKID